MDYKKLNNIIGWLIFIIAAVVYLVTVEPSTSLWDCGEYISTSNKLEVGHPPGAPTFMMLGRLISAFSSPENVAYTINSLSAICSALTILFLFWTITHFAKKVVLKDEEELTIGSIFAILGAGVVGALAYTFSDTFWFSAEEGEVYAMSSFFTAVTFWAILKWEDNYKYISSDRWIILIFFLIGLSIGVHMLNLLVLPAAAFVYYFKKYEFSWKGFFITGFISIAILGFVNSIFIKKSVSFADIFERQFVGMGFNAGTFIFFITLALVLGGLIYYFHKKGSRLGHIITVSLTVLIIGFSSFTMIVVRSNANPPLDENNPETPTALKSYLGREQYGDWPLIYGGFWNSPGKLRDPRSEIGEKYFKSYSVSNRGVKKTFQSQFEADAYITSTGNPSLKVEEEYIVTGKRYKEVLPNNMDNQSTYFPRMYDKRPGKIRGYKFWSGYDGRSGVPAKNPHKGYGDNYIPTTGDNAIYFANYQMGWMYFRYFLWNFAGRQNDVEGHNYHYTGDGMLYKGALTRGNWLSGINIIDKERIGTQNNLPTTQSFNEAYNTYFYLPLILGLIGLVFQMFRSPKDAFSTFLLFFFTGMAIIIYLNQKPEEPRERDYAFAASFYAFAIWIGLGVLALYSWAKTLDMKKFQKGALITLGVGVLFFVRDMAVEENFAFSYSILFMGIVAIAVTGLLMLLYKSIKNDKVLAITITALGLTVPILMGVQNWDDHDRSERYFARDIAKNYLNSCGKNAVLFCFGDNDTFPLWYAQEVEGIRTDMKVMNYSLLGSDWHYSQLKRKTYEAEAVNSMLTEPDYRAGTSDAIYMNQRKRSNKRISANQFIKLIKNDNTKTNKQVVYTSYNKIFIKVDKEAVIKNKVVTKEQIPFIVDYIEWDLPVGGNGYMASKADMAIIDILASYQWERPICFTSRGIQGANKGLGKYLQQEGMTAKFVPIENPGNYKDKMYSLLMGEDKDFTGDGKGDGFAWGGIEKEGIFVDYYSRRMIRSARMHYMQLAESFINSGLTYKNQTGQDTTGVAAQKSKEYIEKAVNVLDKSYEVFPLQRAKVDELSDYLALMYFRAGDTAKGNLHAEELAKLYSENIDYYAAQNEAYIINMIQEIGGFIKHFEQLAQGSSNQKYMLKNYNPDGYRKLTDKILLAAGKIENLSFSNLIRNDIRTGRGRGIFPGNFINDELKQFMPTRK